VRDQLDETEQIDRELRGEPERIDDEEEKS